MLTVLLVDDDPDNRNLLAARTRRRATGSSPRPLAVEALRLMDEHGVPDVAVLDIVMEQITGLDLLDHLRRHDPACAHLPAILMTARHLASDLDEAWALNALLMTKPVEPASQAAAIDCLLQPGGA